MDLHRVVVAATVVCILAVTVSTGPLIGAVSVPETGLDCDVGNGTATVEPVSVPETATLDRGSYDTGVYYLEVPDAVLEVSAVRGCPVLDYKLSVDGLTSTSSVYFLSAENEGRFGASVVGANIAPAAVTRERYNGTVSVILRGNGGKRVVHREPVTVRVSE